MSGSESNFKALRFNRFGAAGRGGIRGGGGRGNVRTTEKTEKLAFGETKKIRIRI
jgi:hypothetical protein